MKWFKEKGFEIEKQNWEIATKLLLSEEIIKQKDKEIEMWIERGDRLSAALDVTARELARAQELFLKTEIAKHGLDKFKEGVQAWKQSK